MKLVSGNYVPIPSEHYELCSYVVQGDEIMVREDFKGRGEGEKVKGRREGKGMKQV